MKEREAREETRDRKRSMPRSSTVSDEDGSEKDFYEVPLLPRAEDSRS